MSNLSKYHRPQARPRFTLTSEQKHLLAQADNIYLIGLMGAGKSTAGRMLAQLLGRPFYDSDDEIVARTGASIPTIFEIEGEAGFREREQRMITELCAKEKIVLGTGGGAILREANQTVLKQTGWVVYLYTTPDRLLLRTRNDRNRPLLQNDNPLAVLTQLFEIRHPIYQAVADLEIKTGAGHVSTVVQQIVEQLTQKVKEQTQAL